MTQFVHTEPWWYWAFFGATVAVLSVFVREMWRMSRESKRRLRLANERRNRVMEDIYWREHRSAELTLALKLRAARLTRERTIPEPLLKAVTQ